jgi:hypothetical protein
MSLNLNLGLNIQNNNYVDQRNKNNLTDTNARAILYLFRPYSGQFGDVGLRPFNYRFDENFLSNAAEVRDLTSRGTVGAGTMIRDLMGRSNLNENLMPSIQPAIEFKASHLNDKWRFLLILTETTSGLLGMNSISTGSNNNTRRIYNGYFVDEPFNTTTFSAMSQTLNPHSYMVITHKTIVGTSVEHGAYGAFTNLNTYASENIIRPSVSRDLSVGLHSDQLNTDLFLMTPENCFNSVEMTQSGHSIVVPGAHAKITSNKASEIVPDLLEQPAHNVAHIMRGIIRTQEDNIHGRQLSTQKHNRMFEDNYLDGEMARQRLSQNMQLKRARMSSVLDLDIDDTISALDLSNMVNGDLDVLPINIETPMFYETADHGESSIVNQFSFLITSVIGPILNSAGLNEMTFEYSIANFQGSIQEDFTTYSAAPCYPVPNQNLVSMTKAVEIELTRGIFATIFASTRDFHVAVNANATGMTTVRLSLIAMGLKNYVDFEFPSCLGGLVSPLLGDMASNVHNAHEIESLCGVVIDVQPIVNSFNSDDREFANYAEEFDLMANRD